MRISGIEPSSVILNHENHYLLLLKNPVTVEWILVPIPYFCDKSKEYLD